jgi:ubiquinone/menaquinone biosynthesis C-methylase UbiE
MDDEQGGQARSFGSVAEAYDRGRPSFPREAAVWLAGEQPVTVLELGAGTGKLTEQLVALGHDVHATDPDDGMLDVLRRRLPDTPTSVAAAEDLPVPDRSFDVVVAAQCFHWFDLDRALPEIARVLKPGGHIALVWNVRDQRIPWARKLGRIIGSQEQNYEDVAQALVLSELFGFVEDAAFKIWQDVNRESLRDLVLSRSNVSTLDDEAREAKLAEVLAFYDDYGRGMDGMSLPYDTMCFKAVVTEREDTETDDRSDAEQSDGPPHEPPSDGTDTEMLLIDFR